jgi:hypothetical protein
VAVAATLTAHIERFTEPPARGSAAFRDAALWHRRCCAIAA